jgi:hypothetical protein
MKKIKLLIALCLTGSMAKAQIIYTFAGNGTSGYSGDGGFAMQAKINTGGYGQGITQDASGNTYFADAGNNVIRKVDLNGIISTFAGTGTAGYSGDGGAASSAELNTPADIAFNSSGDLYIADYSNNRIRCVNHTTGNISTVVGNGTAGYTGDGGAAASAEIHGPTSICFDATGNYYIADNGNNVLRQVNTSNNINTYAGGGSSFQNNVLATSTSMSNPWCVRYSNGYIYYSDGGDFCVRMIKYSTQYVNTINVSGGAMNNFGTFCVDNSGNVYLSVRIFGYSNIYEIEKITVNSSTYAGTLSLFAGNGTSGFSGDGGSPASAEITGDYGCYIASNGDFYFIDQYTSSNHRIRKISATCPSIAGPNVTNQQDDCGNWPGVQIGAPAVPNMTYGWSVCHLGYLSNCAIAQPTSAWTNTVTPKVYTLYVSNSLCTTATSTVQVTAAVNTCVGCCREEATGVAGLSSTHSAFVVYPNPSSGKVTISLYDKTEYIQIIDMQGRTVYETKNANAGELKLDVSSYTKGVYFVMAKIGGKIEKQKLRVE